MKKLFIYTAALAVTSAAITSFSAYAAGTYNHSLQKSGMAVIGGQVLGNGNSLICNGNFQGIPGITVIEAEGNRSQCLTMPEGNGTVADSGQDSFADQVVSLVNQERRKAGLSPLTVNSRAANAAQIRARELAASFSHTRPDGTSYFTALDNAGVIYSQSGENIASGQNSPEEVVKSWMNSAGHRANILNSGYREIGVGHYRSENGTDYWVQLFIQP